MHNDLIGLLVITRRDQGHVGALVGPNALSLSCLRHCYPFLKDVLRDDLEHSAMLSVWMVEFVPDRCQLVHVNNSESDEVILQFGVPQGLYLAQGSSSSIRRMSQTSSSIKEYAIIFLLAKCKATTE